MEFSKSFIDAKGREWPLHIGIMALERLKDAGIPLEEIVPMPGTKNSEAGMMMLSELVHDSTTGVRAVLAILEPALAAKGIGRIDFLESIDTPEVLTMLGICLQGAIVNFFHKSPIRQSVVRQAIKRGREMMQVAAQSMDKAMDKIDFDAMMRDKAAEIETMTAAQLQQPGLISATSTPAS